MSFEQALRDFVNKVEIEYGSKACIKTIVLDETLYRCVEIDLFLKTTPLQPIPIEPTIMQLYTRNGPIRITKQEAPNDRQNGGKCASLV